MNIEDVMTALRAALGQRDVGTLSTVYLKTPNGLCSLRAITVEQDEDDPLDNAAYVVIEVEPAAFGGDGQDNY